ncbi:hypothetical protein HK104_001384 [Borealophlyctis nickersoniae]|nr:hypothetical protein HK104_001384 [Borealophlyctis nickersoniae]
MTNDPPAPAGPTVDTTAPPASQNQNSEPLSSGSPDISISFPDIVMNEEEMAQLLAQMDSATAALDTVDSRVEALMKKMDHFIEEAEKEQLAVGVEGLKVEEENKEEEKKVEGM